MASTHEQQHHQHSKKGSLTNVFMRIFKPAKGGEHNKGGSVGKGTLNDVHHQDALHHEENHSNEPTTSTPTPTTDNITTTTGTTPHQPTTTTTTSPPPHTTNEPSTPAPPTNTNKTQGTNVPTDTPTHTPTPTRAPSPPTNNTADHPHQPTPVEPTMDSTHPTEKPPLPAQQSRPKSQDMNDPSSPRGGQHHQHQHQHHHPHHHNADKGASTDDDDHHTEHHHHHDPANPTTNPPPPTITITTPTTLPNNNHTGGAPPPDHYVPLPFHEGSPNNTPRSSNIPSSNPQQQQHPQQKPRSSGPPEILPEEIEYDPKADFLGQGSFGSVYKGRCRGQEVAVKIPRKQKLTLSELTSFRNEVKIMSKIYHPNVVLFLGACTQMGKMQIVTERCMTDLEKLLASKRPLSLYERMRMAKDAALGMNWLHGITRIVHNDLKSANLLVDNHMRVKVTDFGFSQIKEGDQFVDKSKKGTPLWMAPEVMMGQPYDDKADVYSFGIILWEIVTRDVPYKHHSDYNTFFKAVCYDHERPPLPPDIMPSLKYLITSCWDHNPKNRPSFNEIVFRISEVMVECMIENESARQLWKQYFLLPKQELVEQVTWPDFSACICQNLGLKGPKDSNETLLSNLKTLLVTLPRDTMGQVKEVVTMERFDKVIKWFGEFFDPTCGIKVINEINTLATKSWFHWDISRDESTSRLSMQEDGTFLIRLSSTDPKVTPFTLSLTGNQHRRIKRVGDGNSYKLQGRPKVYTSLQDLVDNCEDYKLITPCPKVDTSNPYEIENFA